MNIEEALEVLEGFLIEPILNDGHKDINKRRVVEIQGNGVERDWEYASTFSEALIKLAYKYRVESKMMEVQQVQLPNKESDDAFEPQNVHTIYMPKEDDEQIN